MATLTLYPTDETLDAPSRLSFNLYMITSIIAILLFMLLGLTMRLNEAQWISLSAPLLYQLLSMHGTGMIGIASLATTAVN